MPEFLSAPPSPRTIWVVRHGQTTGNEAKVMQGWDPYPLSPAGLAQALAQQDRWSSRAVTWVISSPVHRACETAQALFGRIDEIDATWVEEAVPDMVGMTVTEAYCAWPHLRRPDGWPRYDAPYCDVQEHPDTLSQRALLALLRAAHAPTPGPVAVVTHGALVVALSRQAGLESATVPNLAALEIHVTADGWTLVDIDEPTPAAPHS